MRSKKNLDRCRTIKVSSMLDNNNAHAQPKSAHFHSLQRSSNKYNQSSYKSSSLKMSSATSERNWFSSRGHITTSSTSTRRRSSSSRTSIPWSGRARYQTVANRCRCNDSSASQSCGLTICACDGGAHGTRRRGRICHVGCYVDDTCARGLAMGL